MVLFGLLRMLLEQGTGRTKNRKIKKGNKMEMKLLIGLKFKRHRYLKEQVEV